MLGAHVIVEALVVDALLVRRSHVAIGDGVAQQSNRVPIGICTAP